MAIVRWDPSRELDSLQSDMNRLFDTFFQGRRGTFGNGGRWIPAMDLAEADDHYVLHVDLPGMTAGDVDIEVRDGTLTISGERRDERRDEGSGFVRVERAFGRFERSVDLPAGVDANEVKAEFDKGVLQVTVPKPEEALPTKVQINSNDKELIGAGS